MSELVSEIPLTVKLLEGIADSITGKRTRLNETELFYGDTINGPAEISFRNGNQYQGNLSYGVINGQGIMTWPDGVVYSGDFIKGRIEGKGVYTWPDGSSYEGEVLDGLRHGKGKFTASRGSLTYEGAWQKGLKHGEGTLQNQSGTKYSGHFKFGLKHGYGEITYASGSSYKGDWQFDKKNGYGKMHWAEKDEIYEGFWEENVQCGFGRHYWKEEEGALKLLRNRYEGMWMQGLRHGPGIFYYSNGSFYLGEWAKNHKDGFAIFTEPSGEEIHGVYRIDRLYSRLNEEKEVQTLNYVEPNVEENEEESKAQQAPVIKGSQGKAKAKANQKPVSRPQTSVKPKAPQNKNSLQNKSKANLQKDKIETQPNENEEYTNRNKKYNIANPYIEMIQINDLLKISSQDDRLQQSSQSQNQINELRQSMMSKSHAVSMNDDKQAIRQSQNELKQLHIIFLRYNGQLNQLFRSFKRRDTSKSLFSFSMNLRTFWDFLKEAQVLSPSLSLCNLNREFAKAELNEFYLGFNMDYYVKKMVDMKIKYFGENERKMQILASLDPNLRAKDQEFVIPKLDWSQFKASAGYIDQLIKQQKDLDEQKVKMENQVNQFAGLKHSVHNPERVLFFRHFIDAIIRAIFIKNEFKVEGLAKQVENCIVNNFLPILSQNEAQQHEFVKQETVVKNMIQMERVSLQLLEEIMNRCLTVNHIGAEAGYDQEFQDKTVLVRQLFCLLKKSGMLVTEKQKELFFQINQRFFSNELKLQRIKEAHALNQQMRKNISQKMVIQKNISSNNAAMRPKSQSRSQIDHAQDKQVHIEQERSEVAGQEDFEFGNKVIKEEAIEDSFNSAPDSFENLSFNNEKADKENQLQLEQQICNSMTYTLGYELSQQEFYQSLLLYFIENGQYNIQNLSNLEILLNGQLTILDEHLKVLKAEKAKSRRQRRFWPAFGKDLANIQSIVNKQKRDKIAAYADREEENRKIEYTGLGALDFDIYTVIKEDPKKPVKKKKKK